MTRCALRVLLLAAALAAAGLLGTGCTTPSAGPAEGQPAAEEDPAGRAAELPSTAPGPYPDRIVLTWARDPASTLSVTWRTDSTVTGAVAQIAPARSTPSFYTEARTVEAATQPLHTDEVTGESTGAKYHSVTFEGLGADSLYAYRVGDGTNWSEWHHARTAADGPKPFSFIYVGDAQNNVRSHWSRLIREAYAQAPRASFLLHAGDLVDNAHRNVEWGHWNAAGGFIQSTVPSVVVPGNHEYAGYRTWSARDTFEVEVTASGQQMTGTILEPDGNPEPLEASSSGADPSAADYPAGDWSYTVDRGEYVGTLKIRRGDGGPEATLVSEAGKEYPLEEVSITDGTLTGTFIMEVQKESEEQLSIHWHPQFTLPQNGPEGMKETVYHLDHQGMRIVGLNSNVRDSARLRRQTEWLKATLEEARADEDIRWTVATFHHPMFSSGEGRSNERLRKRWTPIFDRYNVDLVLQGHDHTYARGQLTNLKQGVNARSPEGGTVYVNSVSGAKMYGIRSGRWEEFTGISMERGGENTQLYQVVRVEADTIKYRSYTATGRPYDAFDLVRPGDGGPSRMIERAPANAPERTHENTLEYSRP